MKKYFLKKGILKNDEHLYTRTAANLEEAFSIVKPIVDEVKKHGDVALKTYTEKFDRVRLTSLSVSEKEIAHACARIPAPMQTACTQAKHNIEKFHSAHNTPHKKVKITAGVTCFTETRPIEKVGLYVPGGTAPLASTVLMLGIPARIAGCKEIVLATPPMQDGSVADSILYAAHLCGITQIFKVGGAQAIAALAFGTKSIPNVYKIFGPGNQYVTAAKMIVSATPGGPLIDMPAGPSEVLVIADAHARADFVASDLLAQAEHSPEAHVVLITLSEKKADEILYEVKRHVTLLPRKDIAHASLAHGRIIIAPSVKEAVAFSNRYAPEHLILNIRNAEQYVPRILNAGSVFLGPYSSEAAGDYASGTNHSLPTYGYARATSGVSVHSFQKQITFQEVTKRGAKKIGRAVVTMATEEALEGHARAMRMRYES